MTTLARLSLDRDGKFALVSTSSHLNIRRRCIGPTAVVHLMKLQPFGPMRGKLALRLVGVPGNLLHLKRFRRSEL
ncbi:hypothetical protein BJQ89_01951 [Arthrobacter sp. ES1]|nr:hypothetical protein [Arthrobacter sp. ES1]